MNYFISFRGLQLIVLQLYLRLYELFLFKLTLIEKDVKEVIHTLYYSITLLH